MTLLRSATIAVAATVMLAATAGPAAAIVDGQQAQHPYPGMTALAVTYPGLGILKCAAIQIRPRYALTAAHCLSDFTVNPTVTAVTAELASTRTGSTNRTSGGHTAVGATVLLQPDWAWLQQTGRPPADLAVLRLDRPIPGPLATLPARPNADHGPARIIGWGLTEYPVPAGTDLPEQLRQRNVTRLPDTACEGGAIGAGELCVSPGACFGDSGGPTLQHRYQPGRGRTWVAVGLLSRETNTDTPCEKPTINTDLGYYRPWIEATIAHDMAGGHSTVPPAGPAPVTAARADEPAGFTFFMTPAQ
ncbi:S1 family peptidase [Paractinoplanes rishiriensis]|uniref:Serine protease n=1 Tax=Paractinoplanes rishiriensis TaxID=1050105 RepID=A0A919K9S9_9ACTN|nr:trypsin-like serine protease [Actinoplanes rishiriensis]GIF01104.1 serine protease [Actinoplanes rishiriensis]